MYAKGFQMLYLKYCGLSGASIGLVMLFTGIASFVASPLNGAIPDAFAKWSPSHGRPCAAQVSVIAGAAVFTVWVLAAPNVNLAVLTILMSIEALVNNWVTP